MATNLQFIRQDTINNTVTSAFNIGGAIYPVAEMHNSYLIFPNTGSCSGKASMYGVRYS